MAHQISLKGKSALVTGAGVRLGRAFALGLAQAGADVAIHYNRSAEQAEITAAQVREAGRNAVVLPSNLEDEEQAGSLLMRAEHDLGEISLLVNNAALFGADRGTDTTHQDLNRHLAINLIAPILLIQSLAERRQGKSASVVNILDWRALRPGPDHFAYTVAKAGLVAATRALAQAYAPRLRINGLALGAILPPVDADGGANPIERVPLARWAELDEPVEALIYLLGGAGYTTGEILHVDGGRHLT